MPMLPPSTQLSYLIMMQPPLVMLDIIESIADFAPHAAVIQVRTPEDAAEALEKVTSITTAILRMSPTCASAQSLTKRICDLGGQVVFYGVAAEAVGQGPHWRILRRPFTTRNLMALLNETRQERLPALPASAMESVVLVDG